MDSYTREQIKELRDQIKALRRAQRDVGRDSPAWSNYEKEIRDAELQIRDLEGYRIL